LASCLCAVLGKCERVPSCTRRQSGNLSPPSWSMIHGKLAL
jgi:hypothetical protein